MGVGGVFVGGDVESVVGEGPVLDVGAWVVAFGPSGVELAAAFLVDDVDPKAPLGVFVWGGQNGGSSRFCGAAGP